MFYAQIEEGKADILALYNTTVFKRHRLIDKTIEENMIKLIPADAIRASRFGTKSSHAKSQTSTLNYLLKHGGLEVRHVDDHTRIKFSTDIGTARDTIKQLTTELLEIEGEADETIKKRD